MGEGGGHINSIQPKYFNLYKVLCDFYVQYACSHDVISVIGQSHNHHRPINALCWSTGSSVAPLNWESFHEKLCLIRSQKRQKKKKHFSVCCTIWYPVPQILPCAPLSNRFTVIAHLLQLDWMKTTNNNNNRKYNRFQQKPTNWFTFARDCPILWLISEPKHPYWLSIYSFPV